MKKGRQYSISARQIGNTRPSAASSSVMPHRRSTSPQLTPRSSQSRLSCGKMRLISSSRSSCMSRKVEETNTRIIRGRDGLLVLRFIYLLLTLLASIIRAHLGAVNELSASEAHRAAVSQFCLFDAFAVDEGAVAA